MTEGAASPRPRIGLSIWMIISQLLTVGSLLFWLPWIWPLAYSFTYGTAAEGWTRVIFVILLLSSLLVPLMLVLAAWNAYARRRNKRAALLSGLSFALPVLLDVGQWVAILFTILRD